jgi:hypothetical protein
VKINVAAVLRRSSKRKDRMKLSLSPKLVEKRVWVPVISFCRIFIPSYTGDALVCKPKPILTPLIVWLYEYLHYNGSITEKGDMRLWDFYYHINKGRWRFASELFQDPLQGKSICLFEKWILQNCMWKLTTHNVHHIWRATQKSQ